MLHFEAGTSEEWICFQKCLERAFSGQGDAMWVQQDKKVHMLLQREALMDFEAHVTSVPGHAETVCSLKEALRVGHDLCVPQACSTSAEVLLETFSPQAVGDEHQQVLHVGARNQQLFQVLSA